jgi:hypothetical protein
MFEIDRKRNANMLMKNHQNLGNFREYEAALTMQIPVPGWLERLREGMSINKLYYNLNSNIITFIY